MQNINPDDFIQVSGPLFKAVENAAIFPDSKTFVDCVPKSDPEEIMKAYTDECDLKAFIKEHFILPDDSEKKPKHVESLHEYILEMWDCLSKEMTPLSCYDTLLGTPYPHIVPGGRFRENYYWDSYFVVLALVKGGFAKRAKELVANFAHLINHFGHIPNGNRVYYLSRSQPPFFTLMADAIEEPYKDECALEHQFWMRGEELLEKEMAHQHVVRYKGDLLNRYFDPIAHPRPESYREDEMHLPICQQIRAAAESGWDFSSRWMGDGKEFTTMNTLSILPIDLNCLLYLLELKVAPERAEKRKSAIEKHFWAGGFYQDINWISETFTPVLSLAGVFPLFARIASKERADQAAKVIEEKFLRPGGLVTTLVETGQQWDAPNGWAPLQYIACMGLRNYGHDALADEIAKRWKKTCIDFFHKSGKLIEKYNVDSPESGAIDGEYEIQEGFGWTNAVLTLL